MFTANTLTDIFILILYQLIDLQGIPEAFSQKNKQDATTKTRVEFSSLRMEYYSYSSPFPPCYMVYRFLV